MNALPPNLTLLLLGALVALTPTARADDPPPAPARKLDYNRDVRPILANNCFQCHGPDEKVRKAKLRLDTQDGLLALDRKELVARISSHDAEKVMPPAKSGKTLAPAHIATLKTWIEQGAAWSSHWAFTAPVRSPVPLSRDPKGSANPIDNFILARLEKEGLKPSPPADKVTLIRRVTLDLTGLPPTPEEVDAFLEDKSPEAYEKVVDRLLASPRFGERMAWRWLEAARYADTNGYQTDAGRDMWRWRDWVIEAYNKNLPFDQFTIEQLAGDLLPNPTLDQRIATGFNRNHRGNSEGGIVPEEYAAEYVADRVETTATVWLGLTFTCCRCHDHKFDPFPTKDFYRLFAYFNNVPEKGRAVKFGNSPPLIKAPTREQKKQLGELDERVKEADRRVAEMRDAVSEAQRKWERTADPAKLPAWSPARGPVASPLAKAADLDGTRSVDAADVGKFGFDDRFSLACRIHPRKPDGTILSRGVDDPRGEGYGVHLFGGKLQVHLTKRWLDDALRIETIDAVPLNKWSHVVVTYDASRLAAGTKVYVGGVEAKTRVLLDELNQTFETKEPFRVGGGGGKDARFDGLIDDVRVFGRELDATEARLLAVAETPGDILRTHITKRTRPQVEKLRAFFVEVAAPRDIRDAQETQRTLREERQKLRDAIPTVMVMEEMPTPRDTHVLTRGEYDKKGEKVTPGTPGIFTLVVKQKNAPGSTRLDLAKWIVSLDNPLTARVAVNRAWQMHFGVGLVKTAEDFGTQGTFPTHPELLDWLAAEFMVPSREGEAPAEPKPDPARQEPRPPKPQQWDIKRLHKLIVMSATYRQSSRVTKELLAHDPENKLLARYPRLRLSSEMLRDQALFASGLLVEKLGGPSVKPYQPAGLWDELSGTGDYAPDKGADLYRRSLYTYWKRTSPPPVMAAFDAAGRETCWVRESRTNTPLQALALLNETAFVEAARVLAARVMREAKTPDERLTRAFRLVAARTPTARELKVIRENFDFQLAEFRKNPPGIQKLMAIGEARPDGKLDPVELAAYTTVCNLLLNLDEVVTKE